MIVYYYILEDRKKKKREEEMYENLVSTREQCEQERERKNEN